MNTIERREERFARINRWFAALYCLLSGCLAVRAALRGDGYHLGAALGTLAVPAALWALCRLTRLRPAHQLNFGILAYALLAYTLGTCMDFYQRFPGFDKLAHGLSGVLASLMCMALYCALLPGHRPGRRDRALLVLFTFLGSMAAAGMWEIGEYVLSFITGRDLQKVAATGVGDSMGDMMVCMLGTILTLPAAAGLANGRRGPLSGAVRAFAEGNFPGNDR